MNGKPSTPSDPDALLKAIGRAVRDSTPLTEPEIARDDQRLIASITNRIASQQQAERASPSRSSKRRPIWLGFATAASLLLAWLVVPIGQQTAAMPAYVAEISGLDRAYRNAAPDTGLLTNGAVSAGNRLLINLRPPEAYDAPIVATLWRDGATDIESVDVPLQISATGAVRLDALIGTDLALAPGSHRLWLVVAADRAKPDPDQLRAITQPSTTTDRFVLPLTLEMRAP